MILSEKVHRVSARAALAALILAGTGSLLVSQQEEAPAPTAAELAAIPFPEPSDIALPIAEDRGAAALEQSLKRLSTTASLMTVVAHPDDEDGALLTYLSRGEGVRTVLLTLTRGEGGQNAMSADSYDALGLIRTNELLKADEFYGAKQLWGTEVDFGFSKTQEESFAKWGHDRVLYDAVLAVRRERPQVIVSTFVGGVTDGHGHHQVSGEIAQEVFKAAADPAVFPEQLKPVSQGGLGLTVWQPLAVYSMVPFAPVTDKGMFDYATGKWAPARFKNYVTGEWTEGALSSDSTEYVGRLDTTLGRSYVQIAREGWGQQKSQNGGANPALSGSAVARYHFWAAVPSARQLPKIHGEFEGLFHSPDVFICKAIECLAKLVSGTPPLWLTTQLKQIQGGIEQARKIPLSEPHSATGAESAHRLAAAYRQTVQLRARVAAGPFDGQSKASLLFELDRKIDQFQTVFKEFFALDPIAFTTKTEKVENAGPRGGSADETPPSVTPGQEFLVRIHLPEPWDEVKLSRVWLQSRTGNPWKVEKLAGNEDPWQEPADAIFRVHVSEDAEPTQPYFTRPNTEQPYYDLTHPEWRLRPFAPYPLEAWAEFTFDGLPIRVGQVVQTLQRVSGVGGVYEPLVVTPAIGVRVEPEARILPLDGTALPVRVTVHAQAAAEGTVDLKLPAGWRCEPAEAHFHLENAGNTEPLLFSVTPADHPNDKDLSLGTPGVVEPGAYTILAIAHSSGHDYQTGWQSIGYPGLRPYNLYKTAKLQTRKVDVKIAPGLGVGYIMGTGDLVPQAIEGLGVQPHLLTTAEIVSGEFSTWNILVIGIRAYSVHPELTAAEPRLEEFVRRGGTLIVQYQSANFPAPLPLSMGRSPERVVDEQAPVKLLDSTNPLLTWPNTITTGDFDGWLEERGHSFLDSWDPGYTALTETADTGQDPQRGGLLVAHPGKGTYVYVAYALYRQLPELVPGAYRLLANLLSAGKGPAVAGNGVQMTQP